MDAELRLRKQIAQKTIKMGMFGKGVTADAYDEGSAILETAAHVMSVEDAEAESAKECLLHEAVVRSLQRELDTVRSKLMYHSTRRELEQEQEIRALKAQIQKLEAREHWESQYGWTLPGAYLLTSEKDGLCGCQLERRLYGGIGSFDSGSAAPDAGGGAAAGSVRGRGRSDASLRTCACGNRY